jgi:predicted glycosyltransferase
LEETVVSNLVPFKVLMYSHDTYGLGHIRRSLAIARSLRQCPADILILTGSPLVGRFNIPKRIDFVRIPGMFKVTNEQYLPLSMRLDAAEVLEIRKSIIKATAMTFKPDFLIVDKAPLGLKREVVDTLHWVKSEFPSCTSILGLRDIMDSAGATIDEWRGKGIYDAMEQLYNEIWVYGCREFYDPIAEYEIPPEAASKVRFTGYIPRQIPSPREVEAIRRELGVTPGEKLILVTTGGGGDGYPVIKTFLKAFEKKRPPKNMRGVIVTGPFLPSRHFNEIAERSSSLGFTTLKFHRFMEGLIGASQVIVSMGGYNTVCEIISQRKPLLIVPRTIPREEQLIRAQVLCSKGFCDYLHPGELSPSTLRDRILKLLDNGSQYREKMASFPFTGLDVIRKQILTHSKERFFCDPEAQLPGNDSEGLSSHIRELHQC